MNLRCPVCRAENTAGPLCRRCRADLSLLFAVEARRDFLLARAQAGLREGRLDDVLNDLNDADDLRAGPDIKQLRVCLFLLTGDHSAALAEHAGAAS